MQRERGREREGRERERERERERSCVCKSVSFMRLYDAVERIHDYHTTPYTIMHSSSFSLLPVCSLLHRRIAFAVGREGDDVGVRIS